MHLNPTFARARHTLVAATALATAAAGLLPAAATAAPTGFIHAPLRLLHSQVSGNWAGYVSTAGPYTSVAASWTEPKGTCTSATAYSSFWVGLDGDGSNSVEQTGTDVDCSGGSPHYYGWYEMYPAYPVNFSSTVAPGDRLTATVTASGTSFTMKLVDATQGWTKTIHKTSSSAKKHSAEVIAEAPSSSSGILPLANFGSVSFTAASVDGASLGSSGPTELVMENANGTVKAQPSSLSGGTSFAVTWQHS